MFRKIVSVLLLFSATLNADKVLIFTYSYNRPDFIEMQYKTFKKFLKDEYEFIVFNDAADKGMQSKIEMTCDQLGIRSIPIPQKIHSLPYLQRLPGDDFNHPSIRNCNVVQYSLDTLGFNHQGIVALFDSDLFLVKEFSIVKLMQDYPLAGLEQSRTREDGTSVDYLWIGLLFLDMTRMPNKTSFNVNTGKIDHVGVDAGGFTHFYLENNPQVAVRHFGYAIAPFPSNDRDELHAIGLDENQIQLVENGLVNSEFFERGTFIHYRGGTNWDYQSSEYHRLKTELFNAYFESILQ